MGICNNRTVIITGAGAGLGRAYALALGAEGANVVVNDIRAEAAKRKDPRCSVILMTGRGTIETTVADVKAARDARRERGKMPLIAESVVRYLTAEQKKELLAHMEKMQAERMKIMQDSSLSEEQKREAMQKLREKSREMFEKYREALGGSQGQHKEGGPTKAGGQPAVEAKPSV